MHKIREHRLRQTRVTAVFEDRALSFILAKGATLGELSYRLAELGQRRNGSPVVITVKFPLLSRKPGPHRIPRLDFGPRISGRGADGLYQRIDTEKSEHTNVEHSAG